MPHDAILRHKQVADAACATLGLNITHCMITPGRYGSTESCEPGCQAIAVVSEFPEEDHEQLADYRAGNAVDGIAGAEAVISHIDYKSTPLALQCRNVSAKNLISAADVNAVVLPANAFGGPSTLSLAANPDVLIVAVAENTTTLNVDAASVGIDPSRVVVEGVTQKQLAL
ncbi:hypothetical protein FGB62_225g011 [Gracilaria domingensis]|nr:hypothetical protein FGB62_225g011 [Gracilaria domingensis]